MRIVVTLALGLGALFPAVLFAQATDSSVSYQFQFINPGARSLAMGGAFAGLSDDATAVFANPAGLTVLAKPEVSIDFRNSRLETAYFAGGRTGGTPTGRGIDTTAGAIYATTVSDDAGPGFLSIVIPLSRFVLAFAGSEVLRIDRIADSQGIILRFSDTDYRDIVSRNIQDMTIASYGATVAAEIGQGLSVGGGVSVATFSGSERQLVFDPPPPSFGSSQVMNFSAVNLDGTPDAVITTKASGSLALEARAGFLWKLNPSVQFGASYRRGPRFSTERNAITFDEPEKHSFKVPDVFTTGLSVRPTQALALSSEVSFIDYRDLEKSSNTIQIFRAEFPRTVEIRAGAEYVFAARFSPALRVGAWREPYNGPVTTQTLDLDLVQERYPARDAVMHGSFGSGLSLSSKFEVNGAVDISSQSRSISISAIARFGQ